MKTMTLRDFAHDRTLRDAFRARYSAEERTIEKTYDSCPDDFYDSRFTLYRADQPRPHIPSVIKRLIKRNKAFVLDRYKHGGETWSLTGEGYRCPWDTALGAGIIIVSKDEWKLWNKMSQEDRLASLRAFLAEYNDYVNGNVFVVSLFGESCGGSIGHDSADSYAEDVLCYVIRDFAKDRDIEISDISSGNLCGVLSDEDWINLI